VFIDVYIDALCALRQDEVAGSPCFGYGRGGVAYTLLKAGLLCADRALVLSAKQWAVAGIRAGRQFRLRGWPKASFSRGFTGLHAIHALAAHAGGDDAACRRELRRFVDTTRRARGSIELFQGMAGRLAGAAIVMRGLPDPEVRALGDELAAKILGALEAPAIGIASHGVAHGRPGVVLGVLAWQAVSRSLSEDALVRAVAALYPYDVTTLVGRQRVNWAHGHAGMAHLFARAYVELGDRRFLGWAREAAAQVTAEPSPGSSILDSDPGIAYSLLAVAAADPEGPWRDVAWTVVGQVLARVTLPAHAPYGVWSGLGGVCCLALDLVHETSAGFPGIDA
jgi:Lanthionine synthetase C-like protein